MTHALDFSRQTTCYSTWRIYRKFGAKHVLVGIGGAPAELLAIHKAIRLFELPDEDYSRIVAEARDRTIPKSLPRARWPGVIRGGVPALILN